jgi:hypothetical protein
MAASHETTKPVAAKGMRDVVAVNSTTASTRPAVIEGGDLRGAHPHMHADPAGILERLVVQAEEMA